MLHIFRMVWRRSKRKEEKYSPLAEQKRRDADLWGGEIEIGGSRYNVLFEKNNGVGWALCKHALKGLKA